MLNITPLQKERFLKLGFDFALFDEVVLTLWFQKCISICVTPTATVGIYSSIINDFRTSKSYVNSSYEDVLKAREESINKVLEILEDENKL